MDRIEQILKSLELGCLVSLACEHYHITTDEAALHFLDIAHQINEITESEPKQSPSTLPDDSATIQFFECLRTEGYSKPDKV